MPKSSLSKLILFFALLFGTLVRLYPVWTAGFPINDGGMFHRMVEDLIASGFRLPTHTEYNQLNIPFAYPPLPFYLAGFVSRFLQLPLIEVIRWLPALISLLTIPAFFWFARLLLFDENKAAFGTLFFAFMPRSFEWLIMGGGLTRAPAALFFILFAGFLIKAFRDRQRRSILYASLAGGLILLSHPERSLHALSMGLFFFLFFARSKRGLIDALLIGAGTALVSLPWWGLSLLRFGLEPLLQASRAGGDRALFWAAPLLLNFSDETIPLTAFLGVIGIMFELSRRRWFLPLWVLLTFLTDPRSAPHVIPLQFSLLAGSAVVEMIIPVLSPGTYPDNLFSKAGKLVTAYILIIGLVNGLFSATTLARIRLSEAEQKALTWISQNVPSGRSFLIYPSESNLALSPLLEWFPALTSQTSLSTQQGREWLSGPLHSDAFGPRSEEWLACAQFGEECLEAWMSSSGQALDYVLISTRVPNNAARLSHSLQGSAGYKLIYQNPQIEIYQRSP